MATATASSATPSREDFAAMLEESFTQGSPSEGTVVKGASFEYQRKVPDFPSKPWTTMRIWSPCFCQSGSPRCTHSSELVDRNACRERSQD